MLTNVRLSRYDNQFVNNLTLYIIQHNRITSNQDALFRKVSKKYHRQCLHRQINVDDVLGLPWSVQIVESVPEFTGANIKIENGKIIFRSPYNKNFLNDLKKAQPYNLHWIKEKRCYEGPYSPSSLKKLIHTSADHFTIINYCDTVKQIIDTLSVYETAKYWVPTLVYNGQYYIAAINESLYNAIKHIEISDDLASIAQLVKYGVAIDESVENHLANLYDADKIKLAINFHALIDYKNIKHALNCLEQLGCDAVAESKTFVSKSGIVPHLDGLTNNIILCQKTKELQNYSNPVIFYFHGSYKIIENKPMKLFKIIKVVDSEPIKIK